MIGTEVPIGSGPYNRRSVWVNYTTFVIRASHVNYFAAADLTDAV